MHNVRAALRRTFARDVFPPGPNAGCGNVCPLMQMVNELGRDADFDEQSGRQKQQDARQDGIGRCAFLAWNIVCHDHTSE